MAGPRFVASTGFAAPPGADEKTLSSAITRMLHIDDPARVDFYTQMLTATEPPRPDTLSADQRRMLLMLHFDLWGRQVKFPSLDEALGRLWPHTALREELVQLLAVTADRSTTLPLEAHLDSEIPLKVHQRYTRDEVLAAFDDASPSSPPTTREGVRYIRPANVDVFFVTLQKIEGRFTPTTMYKDYAICPRCSTGNRSRQRPKLADRPAVHQSRASELAYLSFRA